jgi:hypothetical protein
MRWLDIDLRTDQDSAKAGPELDRARLLRDRLDAAQLDYGLDSPLVSSLLQELGQTLFQAVNEYRPGAFAPDGNEPGTSMPRFDDGSGPDTGYHLIVDEDALDLPWNCLHTGLSHLLEAAPICASGGGSRPDGRRQWMRRWEDLVFSEQALGPASLGEMVRRFRPEQCAEPGILFLDGRGERSGSLHTQLEREMVGTALEHRGDGQLLAWLETPPGPMTPARLQRTGCRYQAFHFSDSTSAPPAAATPRLSGWDALAADLYAAASAPDEDLEIVGVDPVTSLLDQVSERAERGLSAPWSRPLHKSAGVVAEAAPAWMLEDGPIRPEDLAVAGASPPLVFSNSWLGLRKLGHRFLAAGTSTFVGPHLLVGTAEARLFAADFYRSLARGASVAGALRLASLAGRSRLGDDHPGWLAYGVVGAGSLSLQYL